MATGRNSENDIKSFECPICLNYFVSPIFQCSKGHSLCSKCIDVVSECPSCEVPLKDKIRSGLNGVACTLKFPCEYLSGGCTAVLLLEEKKLHEETCKYKLEEKESHKKVEEKGCHKKVDVEEPKKKVPIESPPKHRTGSYQLHNQYCKQPSSIVSIGFANNIHFGNITNYNVQPRAKQLKIVSEKNAELESITMNDTVVSLPIVKTMCDSLHFGFDWKSLGFALHIPENLINNTEYENRGYGSNEIINELMIHWMNINGNNATVGKLAQALIEIKLTEVALKLV